MLNIQLPPFCIFDLRGAANLLVLASYEMEGFRVGHSMLGLGQRLELCGFGSIPAPVKTVMPEVVELVGLLSIFCF